VKKVVRTKNVKFRGNSDSAVKTQIPRDGSKNLFALISLSILRFGR